MFRRRYSLSALLFLACFTPLLCAQEAPGYAVIDGTQNPPQIVYSTLNIAITDNGAGSYTLVFDNPVAFFLGTSMTEGPVFDAGPTLLSAIVDSSDRRRVNVKTFSVHVGFAGSHSPNDALFSLEVGLAAPAP